LRVLNNWQIGLWTAILLLFSGIGCTPAGNSGSGEVLVRVYDKYLYASDLEGIIPEGASPRDSLTAVRNFIQSWVDRELIVKKAEQNLPDELQDFSSRLEEYRNSLIIFEYEKMLVRQELDTNISSEAIQQYYQNQKNNFVLKEDILDLQYLVLHSDSPAIRKFRQYLRSDEPSEKDSLALYSSKYAVAFSLMEGQWINLDEVYEILPVEEYSYQRFARNDRYLEVRDSVFLYMIRFMDYKPTDSIPPVGFVEEEIKKIILNKRKNDLIKNMRQGVLQDAIEHNQVEIF
jgi:hypothetical protein